MEKAHRVGDQLIWSTGSVLNINGEDKNSPDKYYAVVAMCGHVGAGYFVPILFSVVAKNMDTAKELIRNYPRVKNQTNGCILGIKEISEAEFLFIKSINLRDSYITYSKRKGFMDARRIVLPNSLYREIDRLKDKPKSKIWDLDINDLGFKLVEDYPEGYILQRYFAPRRQGQQIVYPKRVDMDLLLRDYFSERAKNLGIKRNVVQILTCYYKVFGPNNALGVDIKDGKVFYSNGGGEQCSLDLDDFSSDLMKIEEPSRLVDALKPKGQKEDETYENVDGKAKNGLERFNERWKQGKER